MAHTPISILNAAAREALSRLELVDLSDVPGYEAVLCTVSTEYGISYDELETEVQDQLAERAEDDASDAADDEAMYGSDEPMHDGPARLHDDGYYARNDAGEYAWM